MISLAVSVPIACWRKGAARELLETELLPPPSTCYGMLLSLVGEVDRDRHIGARVTSGIETLAPVSTVLRSLWRVKTRKLAPGVGNNASPDFQQLITNAEVVIVLESGGEAARPTLEERVAMALARPETVTRFGGLSLGESTHLVNDVSGMQNASWPRSYQVFVTAPDGDTTLPVWVDHVGASKTAYAVGQLMELAAAPQTGSLAVIQPKR